MFMDNKIPKLKGEQCRILYLPRYSNQIVLGVAGSGKSLEALYRAAWISMSNPNDKMVVLSFNKGVMEDIRRRLNLIVPDNQNIEVDTIYNYFKKLINKYSAKEGTELERLKSIIGNDKELKAVYDKNEHPLSEAISKVHNDFSESTLWKKADYDDFIQSEVEWMMDNAIPYNDENAYLNAERIGRGDNQLSDGKSSNRITKDERKIMYKIYQEYNDIRLSKYNKLFSFNDIYRLIPDLDIPEEDKPKYMIIDEVQDVSQSMFNAMRYVKSDDGYWNVFGDMAQNIFGQRVSWVSMLGVKVNKIYRLDFNYRNSHEIGRFSDQILNYINKLQNDNKEDNTKLANRYGGNPLIMHYDGSNQLYLSIQQLSKNGNLLIITMNKNILGALNKWAKSKELKLFTSFNGYLNDDSDEHKILVQTINQVKGLEFDNVIVLGMDAYNDKSDRSEIIDKEDHTIIPSELDDYDKLKIARRIYVASSRAKDNLVLFFKNSPLEFLLKELDDSYELRK